MPGLQSCHAAELVKFLPRLAALFIFTNQHMLCVNLTAAWLQLYVCYMQSCQAFQQKLSMPCRCRFQYVYPLSSIFILLLTVPSSASSYYSYGDTLLDNANVFGVLPASPARSFAVSLSSGLLLCFDPVLLKCAWLRYGLHMLYW